MTTTILEKKEKIINKKNITFDKQKYIKEMFLSDREIKQRLDELDEYYKIHKFEGIPVKEAYLNGLKELKFEYGI